MIYTMQGALNLSVPLYATALGISYSYAGIAAGAMSLGTTVFDFQSSLVFERIGDRRVVISAFSLMTISFVGLAASRSFYPLVVSLLLTGVGASLWTLARMYFIASNIPFSHRGRVASFFGATGRIGTFVGPIVAGYSIALAGYNTSYALLGVVFAISLVVLLAAKSSKAAESRIVTRVRSPAGVGAPRGGQEESGSVPFRKRLVGGLIFFQILISVVRNGRYFLVPLYGVEILHMNTAAIGLAVGLSGFFDLLTASPSGYMLDRYGRALPSAMSFGVFGAGLLMMAFSHTAPLFILAVVVIGLGNGLSAGILITLGSDISSRYVGTSRTRFLGLWGLTGDGGSALGPIAMGVLSVFGGLPLASELLALTSLTIAIGLPSLLMSWAPREGERT